MIRKEATPAYRLNRWMRLAAAAAMLGGVMAWAAPLRAGAAEDVPQILSTTGVKGGLVVHLGCGDGTRTVQMRAGAGFLVQGLDTAAEKVQTACQTMMARGVYGQVTARQFDGRHLPFIDDMVNLLVVDEPFSVSREEMMRVLCPKGTLCLREGGTWKTETKPWPAGMDEWTHYQHDPQGTMVGRDRLVGPPRRIQWLGDPKWLRNHDFKSSMNALVSSGGRIFYLIDEGLRAHVFLPARWTLVARDAFNGTILWKQPLKDWHPSNWPLKSGPGDLPRRLVAVGDRVFVTLGFREPLSAVDAATGAVLRSYEGTRSTEEIAFSEGTLFLVVDPNKPPANYRAESATYTEIKHANGGWGWSTQSPPRSVVAVEAESGRVLWRHVAKVAPLSLTVGAGQVLFFDGDKMVALNRRTGTPRWESERPPGLTIAPATGAAPRVILSDGVVVLCHGVRVFGFSAQDGKLLWEGKIPPTGHFCPSDLFVIDGLIWSAHTGAAQQKGTHLMALDLHTGATAKDFVAENLPGFPMHPRCYPSRATEQYLLLAGMGTEFYKVGGNQVEIHDYVRGSCIYGVMPCNGLLYKPPDSCACFYQSKLEYFCALAPAAGQAREAMREDERLVQGPAYSDSRDPQSAADDPADWPMYRHDAARSGFGRSSVPTDLKKSWEARLGGKLTQPVMAAGKVYVATMDTHTLHVFDADAGKPLWRFTAGGRIDSPPTIDRGRVIFGSADGWVYCLRAADGALAWRYLVAPDDRQMVSYQQLESVWPLNGSVLAYADAVYALAGRNMFFDGGMRLVRLDATTGRKLSETVLNEIDPQTGQNLQTLIAVKSMPVANPDVLSCDGKYVYMATRKFDLEGNRAGPEPVSARVKSMSGDNNHLFCPTGFLDDLWFHRSYYIYGENCAEGWAEYSIAQRQVPCGRLLVLDESRAYGFRADNLGNTLLPTPAYRLYAADRTIKDQRIQQNVEKETGKKKGGKKKKGAQVPETGIAGEFKVYWQKPSPPLLVNAMALSDKTLFIAGPPDVADESKMLGFLPGADDEINRQLRAQDEAWRGKSGALLQAVAAEDGTKLAEYKLDSPPIFDGMIAAGGRLFLSTLDGRLLCLGNQ
jgi:outer membrane protein assembly factor BamB